MTMPPGEVSQKAHKLFNFDGPATLLVVALSCVPAFALPRHILSLLYLSRLSRSQFVHLRSFYCAKLGSQTERGIQVRSVVTLKMMTNCGHPVKRKNVDHSVKGKSVDHSVKREKNAKGRLEHHIFIHK